MIKKTSLFIVMGYLGAITSAEKSSLVPALEKLQVASPARVADDSFSINYMWIANCLNPAQKWIYPGDDKTVLQKFMVPLLLTAQANTPEDSVNLWYDSMHTSPSAVTITKDMLKQFLSKSPTPCAPIKLKDLRKLEIVKNYASVLGDDIPVYFRGDKLRLAATIDSQLPQRYFVYSDLNLYLIKDGRPAPLSKKNIFDARTKGFLAKYGVVVAQNTYQTTEGAYLASSSFENQFHVVDTRNRMTLQAIRETILDPVFKEAQMALAEDSKTTPHTTEHRNELVHSVFVRYPSLFRAVCDDSKPTTLVHHQSGSGGKYDIPFKP